MACRGMTGRANSPVGWSPLRQPEVAIEVKHLTPLRLAPLPPSGIDAFGVCRRRRRAWCLPPLKATELLDELAELAEIEGTRAVGVEAGEHVPRLIWGGAHAERVQRRVELACAREARSQGVVSETHRIATHSSARGSLGIDGYMKGGGLTNVDRVRLVGIEAEEGCMHLVHGGQRRVGRLERRHRAPSEVVRRRRG